MKFAELNDNDKKVIRGIHNALATRGADWRYPNGYFDGKQIEVKVDPEWANDGGSCFNLLWDGSAACIIGFIAVDQSLPTERTGYAFSDAENWEVSRPVSEAMVVAQSTQDRGYPWGHALDNFNKILSVAIYDYDEELVRFLSEPVGTPNS